MSNVVVILEQEDTDGTKMILLKDVDFRTKEKLLVAARSPKLEEQNFQDMIQSLIDSADDSDSHVIHSDEKLEIDAVYRIVLWN